MMRGNYRQVDFAFRDRGNGLVPQLWLVEIIPVLNRFTVHIYKILLAVPLSYLVDLQLCLSEKKICSDFNLQLRDFYISS